MFCTISRTVRSKNLTRKELPYDNYKLVGPFCWWNLAGSTWWSCKSKQISTYIIYRDVYVLKVICVHNSIGIREGTAQIARDQYRCGFATVVIDGARAATIMKPHTHTHIYIYSDYMHTPAACSVFCADTNYKLIGRPVEGCRGW